MVVVDMLFLWLVGVVVVFVVRRVASDRWGPWGRVVVWISWTMVEVVALSFDV